MYERVKLQGIPKGTSWGQGFLGEGGICGGRVFGKAMKEEKGIKLRITKG